MTRLTSPPDRHGAASGAGTGTLERGSHLGRAAALRWGRSQTGPSKRDRWNFPTLAVLVVLAVTLATLSLALTFTPGYDPWTWALWGHEVAHLDLSTVAGPAWKPLPVALLAVTSPLGHASVVVWIVVARAGGLLAVLLAGRLAYRAARPVAGTAGAVTAAAIAGASLLLSVGFTGYLLVAMSEPLLAAGVLLAIYCGLDRRYTSAFVLLALAALLRPEAWPLLLVAGAVVVAHAAHRLRASLMVIGTIIAVLALWYVPDWLGSGDFMRSAERASIPTQGGPLLTRHPALAVLDDARTLLPLPWLALSAVALVATAFGLSGLRTRGKPAGSPGGRAAASTRTVALVAATGLLWLAVEVALTATHRSSGEPRYLMVTAACVAVLSGVGAAVAAGLVARGGRRLRGPRTAYLALAVAATGAVAAWAVAAAVPYGQKVRADFAGSSFHTQVDLDVLAVLSRAGGRDAVRRCGTPITGPYQVPEVAFRLGLHLYELQYHPDRTGLVVEVPGWSARKEWPPVPSAAPIRSGDVTMWQTRPCVLTEAR